MYNFDNLPQVNLNSLGSILLLNLNESLIVGSFPSHCTGWFMMWRFLKSSICIDICSLCTCLALRSFMYFADRNNHSSFYRCNDILPISRLHFKYVFSMHEIHINSAPS